MLSIQINRSRKDTLLMHPVYYEYAISSFSSSESRALRSAA